MTAYRYTSSMMARGKPTDSKVCKGAGTSCPSTRKASFCLYSSPDMAKFCLPAGRLCACAPSAAAAGAEEP